MSQHLDLDKFRQRLEEMRASLQSELELLHQEWMNGNQTEGYGIKNHPAEDASELFYRERSLAIRTEVESELQAVEHALQRIAAGTYGICEMGGEPIPIERLEARPAATLCVDHQRERDHQERNLEPGAHR
jgi:RNA polymerase-binding protein DksA